MKYYFLGIFLALLSCNGQKKTVTNQSENSNSLELLLQEEYIGFDIQETMVIKDQKSLKSFYSKLNRTRKPGLPIPEVDFTKSMVVVQCSGEKNYIGVPILSFEKETDAAIVLNSQLIRNKKYSSQTMKTYPFCLYKMPFTEKDIVVNPK